MAYAYSVEIRRPDNNQLDTYVVRSFNIVGAACVALREWSKNNSGIDFLPLIAIESIEKMNRKGATNDVS
jgi:hypothetical protein